MKQQSILETIARLHVANQILSSISISISIYLSIYIYIIIYIYIHILYIYIYYIYIYILYIHSYIDVLPASSGAMSPRPRPLTLNSAPRSTNFPAKAMRKGGCDTPARHRGPLPQCYVPWVEVSYTLWKIKWTYELLEYVIYNICYITM